MNFRSQFRFTIVFCACSWNALCCVAIQLRFGNLEVLSVCHSVASITFQSQDHLQGKERNFI